MTSAPRLLRLRMPGRRSPELLALVLGWVGVVAGCGGPPVASPVPHRDGRSVSRAEPAGPGAEPAPTADMPVRPGDVPTRPEGGPSVSGAESTRPGDGPSEPTSTAPTPGAVPVSWDADASTPTSRTAAGGPAPSTFVAAGPSFLPNLGLEVGLERTVSRSPTVTRSLDVHGAWQFLDDEDFADDGNPAAGPWYQVRAGVRWSTAPDGRRHLVTRLGGVWIRAEGEPNIVQEEGDYLGVYGGVGFQTDLTPRLSVGPELTVLGVTRTTGFPPARPIPQVNWHARVRLGPAPARERPAPALPRGEIYGGLSAVTLPGFGGGILAGQVFRRGASATWSVEVAAARQPPRGRLLFEEDGRWAQVQVGVKAALDPGGPGHWVGRGGAVWLRSTASNPFLDVRADHVGAYVGIGYERDLTDLLTTGPDLNLLLVSYEQDVAFRVVPQLRWHVLLRP